MVAPQKSECPVGAGHVANGNGNELGEIIATHGEDAKAADNYIAALALRGFAVHRVADGFLVCRWNLAKHCPDLRALAGFAKCVGVSA